MPVVEFECSGGSQIDTRQLLYSCYLPLSSRSVNLLIEHPASIVFGSSVEQFGCSLFGFLLRQWGSGAINHWFQCLVYMYVYTLLFCFASTVDCERIS